MCNGSQRLGIEVRVRTVDPAQYQHLTDDFDFDMTIDDLSGESTCPGNELRDYWSCAGGEGRRAATTVPASAIRRWTR